MYFDLYHALCNDPRFLGEMEDLAERIDSVDDPSSALQELLRKTQYNFGLLVPFCFPNYHGNDRHNRPRPMSLMARPYAFAMFQVVLHGMLVIKGSRQIGKSTTLAARQLVLSSVLPNYKSLYLTSHPHYMKTYANRLAAMARHFRFLPKSGKLRQNLNFREFGNDSTIALIYALTSDQNLRSNTADEVNMDEAQHFDPEMEPEARQIQRSSSVPSTVIAGTSLTLDTFLEAKFDKSSKGSWYVKCGCGQDIHFCNQQHLIEMMKPDTLRCFKCSRPVNVRSGYFLHEDREAMADRRIGLHIPQVIIPEYVEDPSKWNTTYNDFIEMPIKKFLMEACGIATEESSREIGVNDLKRICFLGESRETLRKKALGGYYRHVVSGCDWGGSEYSPVEKTKVSYTVHAIIGVTYEGDFEILYFRSYEGMDYYETIANIINNHVAYGGTAFASDAGAGTQYNLMLRESTAISADRHFIMGYSGTIKRYLDLTPDSWYNLWTLNRTESISDLFRFIKQERPRLRCHAWGESARYLHDFLNLYRVPTEDLASGKTQFKYRRHGSKADDSLHAVNFAIVLGRLLLGENLMKDAGLHALVQHRLRNGASGGGLGAGLVMG